MATENQRLWIRILVIVGRLGLAGIFLAAAYAKLKPQLDFPWSLASIKTSLDMFALQVDSYQLLSPDRVSLVAHILPPLEFFLGLWLLSGIFPRVSSVLTTALIAAFFSLTIRTYRAGLEISCGCFGPGGKLGIGTILRDGSFLALALFVMVGTFFLLRGRGPRDAVPTTDAELAPSAAR